MRDRNTGIAVGRSRAAGDEVRLNPIQRLEPRSKYARWKRSGRGQR
jgi:hypothetical protein